MKREHCHTCMVRIVQIMHFIYTTGIEFFRKDELSDLELYMMPFYHLSNDEITSFITT